MSIFTNPLATWNEYTSGTSNFEGRSELPVAIRRQSIGVYRWHRLTGSSKLISFCKYSRCSEKCPFAHTVYELYAVNAQKNPNYKTEPCKIQGCKLFERCVGYHPNELARIKEMQNGCAYLKFRKMALSPKKPEVGVKLNFELQFGPSHDEMYHLWA